MCYCCWVCREHQERLKGLSQQNKGANSLQTSLEGLLHQDATVGQTNFIERAWHGAEAYHFFLLAQRQLYDQKYTDAMITAAQLNAYDDVIPPRQVYSLVALTAAMAPRFLSAPKLSASWRQSLVKVSNRQIQCTYMIALIHLSVHRRGGADSDPSASHGDIHSVLSARRASVDTHLLLVRG